MKLLVQRVRQAAVSVGDDIVGQIGPGLLVFLGVERDDDAQIVEWYADRLLRLKLFADEGSLWRKNVGQVGGGILVVSQFTLAAKTRKGLRPSFDPAAPPEQAERLYRVFIERLAGSAPPQVQVEEGRFGAMMQVQLTNDGPVTFLLDGPGSTGD